MCDDNNEAMSDVSEAATKPISELESIESELAGLKDDEDATEEERDAIQAAHWAVHEAIEHLQKLL